MTGRKRRASADAVRSDAGRQYHLDTAPGEIAPWVLLVGDPERADRVARRFERIEVRRRHREFVTLTGPWRGEPLTVCATGIGADNTEIAVLELLQCVRPRLLLRVGSCGALQERIGLGDLVVSTGAVRLESTSLAWVPEGYPALAHPEVVLALRSACRSLGVPHHVGVTATSPGFYGAQGRHLPGFPAPREAVVEDLARLGVLNLEMEASALFTLASLAEVPAGAVCAVYAQRRAGELGTDEERSKAEASCIEAALGAVDRLRACARLPGASSERAARASRGPEGRRGGRDPATRG